MLKAQCTLSKILWWMESRIDLSLFGEWVALFCFLARGGKNSCKKKKKKQRPSRTARAFGCPIGMGVGEKVSRWTTCFSSPVELDQSEKIMNREDWGIGKRERERERDIYLLKKERERKEKKRRIGEKRGRQRKSLSIWSKFDPSLDPTNRMHNAWCMMYERNTGSRSAVHIPTVRILSMVTWREKRHLGVEIGRAGSLFCPCRIAPGAGIFFPLLSRVAGQPRNSAVMH